MSDESLALSAVVLDKFSQPILDLQRKLRTLSAENAKQHTAGASLVKSHSEGYAKFSEQVHKTSEVFRREFSPVLRDVAEQASGLRFAFTGAAGAAAAVVGAVAKMSFNFAGSSFELENLGKATGWTTDQLRRFEAIGPRIGTTTDAMAAGAKNVASIFQTMNKGQVGLTFERSELFEKLKDPNTVASIERLRNLKPQQQMEGIEHLAEGIKSPADRRDFYKALGLPEEMASASAEELKKYSEEIKKNLGTIPESSTEAGDKAARAWIDFKEKLQGVANYIGSEFAPTLEGALKGAGDAVVGFERVAGGFGDAVKLDPAALASWRDLGVRIKGALNALDDPADIANVAKAFKTIIEDFDSVAKAVDSISTDHHLDWTKVLNVTGLADQIEKLRESAKAIENIYEKIPGYKALQETKNAPTEATPIPGLSGIGDAIKKWLTDSQAPPASLHDRPPIPAIPSPPPAPTPAPPPFSFKKPEIGPPMPKPAFSPISYRPGDDNPMIGKGVSSGTSDAVRTIALGTRAGVAAGMGDFYLTLQAMKGLSTGGGGGVMPASYETGSGGLGGGSGGLGGGPGGGGRPDDGAGAGGLPDASPAGRIGHEVRKRLHGHGGGGGPEASPGVPYTPGDITKTMGITPEQYKAFTSGVAQIEGGAYGKMGGASGRFAGRYQMGGEEIKETAARLGEPTPTRQQFLSDPKMQERFMEAYSAEHYRELMRAPKFQALSQTEKLEMMGYAHNQGVGGALKYLRSGQIGRDAFGTPGTAYFEPIRKRLEALTKPVAPVIAGNDPPVNPNRIRGKSDPINPTFGPAWEAGKFREGIFTRGGLSGPHNVPPSGYDKLRAHLKMLEESGLGERPGHEEWEKLGKGIPWGEPKPDDRFNPYDKNPWGHLGRHHGEQQASLRREPGALLKASSQMQASAMKHEITGGASLHVKLASGLAPVGGVKNTGNAFQTVKLDRAPSRVVADTTA